MKSQSAARVLKRLNYKQGLRRTTLVWVGFWAIAFGYGLYARARGDRMADSLTLNDMVSNPFADLVADRATELQTQGAAIMKAAVILGALVPIGLAVTAFLGMWIARGFMPKDI